MAGCINDYTIRVRAGPDDEHLVTISVNDEFRPTLIDSEHFTGYLVVRMANFDGVTPAMERGISKQEAPPIMNPQSDYFSGKNRRYSIMMQGRFKKAWSGDEVLFGVNSEIPLRTPMGIGMGVKLAKWLDPSIEACLDSESSYMYSPFISAMNSLSIYEPGDPGILADEGRIQHVTVVSTRPDAKAESFHSAIGKWSFHSSRVDEDSGLLNSQEPACSTYEQRKKHFSDQKRRETAQLSPDRVYAVDFYDAYADFATCSIKMPGFSMGLFKYWDGQPLRYSATTRDKATVFFVVSFELVAASRYAI